MFYIACTRFNNTTYDENINYRSKHNENVIYGSALKIRDKYPAGCLIFIAEMNNDKNIFMDDCTRKESMTAHRMNGCQ